ncbi:MAG TPA: FHA domain-containing protein [Pseudonocardia sp.]|nr:FHA domain-containing protein [Pseudonocardia sp.]
MPELVLQLTRAGFLALLWLFVLVTLRVVRSDLYAASGLRALVPGGRTATRTGRGRTARQLLVTQGALAGTRVSLDSRPILIGRADDSTLVLDDDYASTRHARIALQGEEWYVEDLGSTNGTYLDRAKVTGPTRVPLGVPVRIGKTVIELRS